MQDDYGWSRPPPNTKLQPLDHVPVHRGVHPIKRGLAAVIVLVGIAAAVWLAWPLILVVVLGWLWWEALKWATS